jgi:hypothetical protein
VDVDVVCVGKDNRGNKSEISFCVFEVIFLSFLVVNCGDWGGAQLTRHGGELRDPPLIFHPNIENWRNYLANEGICNLSDTAQHGVTIAFTY